MTHYYAYIHVPHFSFMHVIFTTQTRGQLHMTVINYNYLISMQLPLQHTLIVISITLLKLIALNYINIVVNLLLKATEY